MTSSNRAPARGSNTNARRAAKRAALAQATAERKRARQRRQALLGALGAVLVIVLSVVLVMLLTGGKKKHSNASTPAGPVAVSDQPAASSAPSPTVSVPAALSKKPVVNGSGAKPTKLEVKTLVAGTGPAVKSGQTVTFNYVGVSMTTGKEFDSSWSRNQPFTTAIGTGQVIKGWDEGLVGVKIGSRVQLDIPTDLAYGSSPPSADVSGPLRFVVDVLAAS